MILPVVASKTPLRELGRTAALVFFSMEIKDLFGRRAAAGLHPQLTSSGKFLVNDRTRQK